MAKSKYESHVLPNLDKILKWAEAGATAKDIAAKLRVAYSTFRNYVDLGEGGDERYSALSAAFARAREIPNDIIEHALFDRARGIEYEEKTFETKWNAAAEAFEEVCTKRVTKYIPPDPTSLMFWLTNQMPDKWKYKPQGEEKRESGSEAGVIVLPEIEVKADG